MATMKEVVQGLNILSKYTDVESHNLGADHDVLYVGVKRDISDEDQKALESLGWHWSIDADSWARFV